MLVSILAATVLVSWFSYTLIEDPLRRVQWFGNKRNRYGHRRWRLFPDGLWRPRDAITGIALFALIVAGMSAAAVMRTEPAPASAAPYEVPSLATEEPTEAAPTTTPELDALQAQIGDALTATRWPDDLNPTMDEVIGAQQAPADIMPCGLPNPDFTQCEWGEGDDQHTIMIVGSSISMTYVNAVRSALGEGSGWRVVSRGMFGCPFTDWAVDDLAELSTEPVGCAERNDEVVEEINATSPGVVMVSGFWSVAGAQSQLAKLTAEGSRVWFMPGPPQDKNPAECFTPNSSPADCVSVVPDDWAFIEQNTQSVGVFVDTRPWFCANDQCPAFVGSIPTRVDAVHMTPQYAERLGPVIREYLVAQNIGFPVT